MIGIFFFFFDWIINGIIKNQKTMISFVVIHSYTFDIKNLVYWIKKKKRKLFIYNLNIYIFFILIYQPAFKRGEDGDLQNSEKQIMIW